MFCETIRRDNEEEEKTIEVSERCVMEHMIAGPSYSRGEAGRWDLYRGP